ncbi:MAG: ATP-binding protein, partial [Gammaproteobacteria bacterium]|nr:ATP-binding protein [Gammaproteobacteria bacterium]
MSERFFNNAGPVNCDMHYCLPPLERFDLTEIEHLIAQQRYFVLHAPRQTGKTSSLLALADHLNQRGDCRCLYVNVESGQSAREDVHAAIQTILGDIAEQARIQLKDERLLNLSIALLQQYGAHGALAKLLTRWTELESRPALLFIDEIDALIGDTLIAVLRQLRSGYPQRPHSFPQSVILCGVRDVRDYRIHSSRSKEIITGGSAFNIKAESMRMGNFTQSDVEQLCRRHTEETGQIFTDQALKRVWAFTEGQPWLVNALAYEVTFRMKENRDRTRTIELTDIEQAKEQLILRRDTHLDQLADKLEEERVRRVIEPILAGGNEAERMSVDDMQYVADLGLVTTQGRLRIANLIYQEVIPRELIYTTSRIISHEPAWYTGCDGRLQMDKLLTAFQQFFREHSEHWLERFDYKEAGPQLLLQAFLQRIVNGGGRIEREYGL